MVGWAELHDRLGRTPEPIRTSARFAHRPPHDWFVAYDDGEISLDTWEPGRSPFVMTFADSGGYRGRAGRESRPWEES